MIEWWAVLLAFGLVARVSRFLTDDVLAAPIRMAVSRRFGEDSAPAYLVECQWCVSTWVAVVVVPVALVWGESVWFVGPALVASIAYAYGLLASNLDT